MFNAGLVTPDGLIDPSTEEITSDNEERDAMDYESGPLKRDIPSLRAFFKANPKINQNTEARLGWPPTVDRGDKSKDSNDKNDKDENEVTDNGIGNDGESNGGDDNSSNNDE